MANQTPPTPQTPRNQAIPPAGAAETRSREETRAREDQGDNHGEGNPEAAARFNKAEQAFVQSPRGQQKIHEAGDVRPDEEGPLEDAERVGREHSKDPGEATRTGRRVGTTKEDRHS